MSTTLLQYGQWAAGGAAVETPDACTADAPPQRVRSGARNAEYHGSMVDQENAVIERAYSHLRRNSRAELRFEEHWRPVRYVIAPGPAFAGRLVAPVMVAMLDAVDTALYVPECVEDAMEIQVTLEEFKETGDAAQLADRWRIYHGEPSDVRWTTMLIDMARWEQLVIDGEALMRSNPFAGEAEAAICRHMNEDHTDDLRRLCAKYAHMEIEAPVMVGIDPWGVDVRARFDMVRVEAVEEMRSREEARRVLTEMTIAARQES